jgi:hypothetical protein
MLRISSLVHDIDSNIDHVLSTALVIITYTYVLNVIYQYLRCIQNFWFLITHGITYISIAFLVDYYYTRSSEKKFM